MAKSNLLMIHCSACKKPLLPGRECKVCSAPKRNASAKASKLTSTCDVCGQPGRPTEKMGTKCYEHYWEAVDPKNYNPWNVLHEKYPLDKTKIRAQLEKIGYTEENGIEKEIEYRYAIYKIRHEGAIQGAKKLRENFENG